MTACTHRAGACLDRDSCWRSCLRKKPILVGEGPSASGDRYHAFPLSGQVGKRLCTWAGIEPLVRDRSMSSDYARYYWALREKFDLVNFFERWPQDWSNDVVVPMVRTMVPLVRGRVVVLLGARLGDAFAKQRVGSGGFYHWHREDALDLDLTVLPHPSGLNRMYNAEDARRVTGEMLREAVSRASAKQG